MTTCPNFGNPEVVKDFNELKNATSELAAYRIWSLNNGNAIDRAPNGAPSKLFLDLSDLYNGDRVNAILAKAKTYGVSFFDLFGNWVNGNPNASKTVDKNGEPLIAYLPDRVKSFTDNSGTDESTRLINFANRYYLSENNSTEGDIKSLLQKLGQQIMKLCE